jgi:predicted Zn-dependent protease
MKILLVIAALFLFASCSNQSVKSERVKLKEPKTPPVENEAQGAFAQEVKDEVTVGQGMATRLLGTYGYSKKYAKLERYINLVGLSLIAQSGRPELKYHFAVLDSEEVNAFATPGGYIFVTKGLLKNIKSEDELAGVLGHEIAHVNMKHMYKEIAIKREVSTGEVVTRIISRGGADIGGALNIMVSKGMKMLIEDGLGKEKEAEADEIGVIFASASGYDPTALLRLVQRLEGDKTKVQVGKTHPHGEERVVALQSSISKNGLSSKLKKNQNILKKRFAEAFANL